MAMPQKPDYTQLKLSPPPPDRPTVLLNMVMSADGKVVIEGTERGLGSPVDHRLMRELRVNADVVLNGAHTLRASGTSSRLDAEDLEAQRRAQGKTPAPIAAVLTRSGDLPTTRAFFTRRDFPAIVYLSSAASAARRKTLEATGRPVHVVPNGEEIPSMLRHMRQKLAAEVCLLEGGSTINAAFFALDAIDEYFVTLSPIIVGGVQMISAVEGPRISTIEQPYHLALVSALPNSETGEVYLHYHRAR